jgi:hypothetical protein
MDEITGMCVFIGMNTKRKFLHLVDLRVQRYFAGSKVIGFPHAEREHGVEAQGEEASPYKGLSFTDAAARPSAL